MLMLLEACPVCGDQFSAEDSPAGLCPHCLLLRGAALVDTAEHPLAITPGMQSQFVPPDPTELEADLPAYDIDQLLGRGGMGAVYKARHRGLDRIVAIKILPRRDGEAPFCERFEREAKALARLNHENIVMAFDFGLTERYAYCVMEYVDGPNLRELMELEGISPDRAAAIARDVGRGLEYAHQCGVVHRDIKPENVLVGYDGQVKIADFGLAKLIALDETERVLTHTRHFMGTVHYMAPEQVERPHQVDHRVDIYSAGVLLYEMLTGELPLGRWEAPSKLVEVDERFDSVVLTALEKDPQRRPQSAEEFSRSCERLLEPDRDVKPVTAAGGRRRVSRRVLIAAGLFPLPAIIYFGWQLLLEFRQDKDGGSSWSLLVNRDDDGKEPKSEQETRPKAGDPPKAADQTLEGARRHGESIKVPANFFEGDHAKLHERLCIDCHTPASFNQDPAKEPKAAKREAAQSLTERIDDYIRERLENSPLKEAEDDTTFASRAWLDIFGAPPGEDKLRAFLESTDPRKREKLLYELWVGTHLNEQTKGAALRPDPSPNRGQTAGEAFDSWVNRTLTFRKEGDPVDWQKRSSAITPSESNWKAAVRQWNPDRDDAADLPIRITSAKQVGEYPDKRLSITYETARETKARQHYLMLVGPHIGGNELTVGILDGQKDGTLITPPLPKAGNGEPLEVFFETLSNSGAERLRASNVAKLEIAIAVAPSGEIRYNELLLDPIKAIHWEHDRPRVEVGERWYSLTAIDGIPTAEIMEQAKRVKPDAFQEVFEKDAIGLMHRMGRTLQEQYSLTLGDGETETALGFKLTHRERARWEKLQRDAQKQGTRELKAN